MSRALVSRIAAWLLRVLKAMPSMGSVLLHILRSILSQIYPANSRQKHSESSAVRTICASSIPSPLQQEETTEVSPSHMHPSLINDAGRGMVLATQPDDSMIGTLPVH
ncbi:hypothetical protein BKA83DRAFT_4331468, partial [Pisolithus microcarpus]